MNGLRRLGLLGLVLALSACAVGGAAGPDAALPVAGDDGSAPPGEALTLTASDGTAVPATLWRAERARAVILALHGYGDYGPSTYGTAAPVWAGAGITTYAPDQRGFGRGPTRGQWPGAEALVADAVAYARALRARHPDLPLILLGHSMGGGIALAAAAQGAPVDGLVLAAPAIWGGSALNPLQRLAAWSAAAVVPDRRFTGEGVVRIQASDNIEAMRALGRDPHYLGAPSARELLGLVRVTDAAAAGVASARQPALLLLGEKDEIVPNDRVERVFETRPGPGRVMRYPEGWHLLFRDLQAPRVHEDVADWVLGTLDPVPSGTASPDQAALP
ncbi:MAG: alpha/beta fold hydrolase [Pseudomonadota bacterium]